MTSLARPLASASARCSAPPGLLSCSCSKSQPRARERTFCSLLRQGWSTGLVPTLLVHYRSSPHECHPTAVAVQYRKAPHRVSILRPFPFHAAHAIAFVSAALTSLFHPTFPTLPDVLYLCPILDLTTYIAKYRYIQHGCFFCVRSNLHSHQLRPRFRTPIPRGSVHRVGTLP
jgi:hypothetical protein